MWYLKVKQFVVGWERKITSLSVEFQNFIYSVCMCDCYCVLNVCMPVVSKVGKRSDENFQMKSISDKYKMISGERKLIKYHVWSSIENEDAV
jgi:hypothetical protein